MTAAASRTALPCLLRRSRYGTARWGEAGRGGAGRESMEVESSRTIAGRADKFITSRELGGSTAATREPTLPRDDIGPTAHPIG
jgi:hypothetical protein